jgi:hypothetical protein
MMLDSGSLNSNYCWGETKNSASYLSNKSPALSINIHYNIWSSFPHFSHRFSSLCQAFDDSYYGLYATNL